MSGPEIKNKIKEAKDLLKDSTDKSPWEAWPRYIYGCELVKWAIDGTETNQGIMEVVQACGLLDDIKYEIVEDHYLSNVLDHPKIKPLIDFD